MHILVVTFQLSGLSVEEYERYAAEIAPTFAALPGLVSKLWLSDPEANIFGGVYLWETRDALKAYLNSAIFRSMATHPYLKNVSFRACGMIDEANAITAGPLLAAVAHPA